MRGPSSRELRTFRKLTERDRENQTGQNRDLDVPHLFESRPSEAWHSRYAMSESNDARHTRNISCVCTTTPSKLFFFSHRRFTADFDGNLESFLSQSHRPKRKPAEHSTKWDAGCVAKQLDREHTYAPSSPLQTLKAIQ